MIKNFKPIANGRYVQGYYRCKNPLKYKGDINKIIYRSSYELKLFKNLDLDSSVTKWSAEPPEHKISYYSTTKSKRRSYYPDAYCEKMINGIQYKLLIEVKPSSKVNKPVRPKTITNKTLLNYRKRVEEYITIQDKRIAAEKYAKIKGMKFIFITEKTINKL